jgi:DNA-binding transcriptional LysR family regulator
MEVRQLEYVVAVAEEGSFTRAAQRCHVAQSALSQQVARLERELATKLFERTSRSVRLSESGATLLPHARRILEDMANARLALDQLAEIITGQLRIGMTQTANKTLDVVGAIGEFHHRYPAVVLATMSGPEYELVEEVQAGHLDVALAALNPDSIRPGLVFSPLADPEPLVAVVPANHPLARRRRVRLVELESSEFVEFRARTVLRNMVDDAFNYVGVERRSAFEVGQITDIIDYVASGLGVAVIPRVFATSETPGGISQGGVTVLQLSEPTLSLTIGAHKRVGPESLIVSTLLDIVTRRRRSGTTPIPTSTA